MRVGITINNSQFIKVKTLLDTTYTPNRPWETTHNHAAPASYGQKYKGFLHFRFVVKHAFAFHPVMNKRGKTSGVCLKKPAFLAISENTIKSQGANYKSNIYYSTVQRRVSLLH